MADLIKNKKAKFNFELGDTYEAGIELNGIETKSLRNSRGSLDGSYVGIRGGEAFLIGAEIPAYQPANATENYDPKRVRKLLLSKREIAKMTDLESRGGHLTFAPISLYNKGRNIKLKFAVGIGKKKTDKRQTIRRREDDRDNLRTLKKMR